MKSVMSRLFKLRPLLFVGVAALMIVLSLAQVGWASSVWAGTVPGKDPLRKTVGAIWLRAVNAPVGAWASVQWLDSVGKWHDVEPWIGPLEADPFFGGMPRWVDPVHFGTGPYRWVVYSSSKMDKVWGTSASFSFPKSGGEWLWITVPGK